MTGGANNWMGMIIDQKTGIAYIPLGSASMDFYGGKKRGYEPVCGLYAGPGCQYRKTYLAFSIYSSRYLGLGSIFCARFTNGHA